MLHLTSSGNPAESDKKCLKVLLKVSKKAERHSICMGMMDSCIEYIVRYIFFLLFHQYIRKIIHRINYHTTPPPKKTANKNKIKKPQ